MVTGLVSAWEPAEVTHEKITSQNGVSRIEIEDMCRQTAGVEHSLLNSTEISVYVRNYFLCIHTRSHGVLCLNDRKESEMSLCSSPPYFDFHADPVCLDSRALVQVTVFSAVEHIIHGIPVHGWLPKVFRARLSRTPSEQQCALFSQWPPPLARPLSRLGRRARSQVWYLGRNLVCSCGSR